MMRFDRFTERAQDAAARADEILQRYGHNQIDTEHILLALIEQPEGVIPQILEKMGVDPEAIRYKLDEILKASPKASIYGGGAGQVFMTPRVKRIIDVAQEEATRLKDEYISTEHLFLAILGEQRTAVARIMKECGDHQRSRSGRDQGNSRRAAGDRPTSRVALPDARKVQP